MNSRSLATVFAMIFLSLVAGCSVKVPVTRVDDKLFTPGDEHSREPGLYYGLPRTSLAISMPVQYTKPGLSRELFESIANFCENPTKEESFKDARPANIDSYADPHCTEALQPVVRFMPATVQRVTKLDKNQLFRVDATEAGGSFLSRSLGIRVNANGILTGFNGQQHDSAPELVESVVKTVLTIGLSAATGVGVGSANDGKDNFVSPQSAPALLPSQVLHDVRETVEDSSKLSEEERDSISQALERLTLPALQSEINSLKEILKQKPLGSSPEGSAAESKPTTDEHLLQSHQPAVSPTPSASESSQSLGSGVSVPHITTSVITGPINRILEQLKTLERRPSPPKECTCGYIRSVKRWIAENGGNTQRDYETMIATLMGDLEASQQQQSSGSSSRNGERSTEQDDYSVPEAQNRRMRRWEDSEPDGHVQRVRWEYLDHQRKEVTERVSTTLSSYGVSQTQWETSLDLRLKAEEPVDYGDHCHYAYPLESVLATPFGTDATRHLEGASDGLLKTVVGISLRSESSGFHPARLPAEENGLPVNGCTGAMHRTPESSSNPPVRTCSGNAVNSSCGQPLVSGVLPSQRLSGFVYRFPVSTEASVCAIHVVDPWPTLTGIPLKVRRDQANFCAKSLYLLTGKCDFEKAKESATKRENELITERARKVNEAVVAALNDSCSGDSCKASIPPDPCTASATASEIPHLRGIGTLLFRGNTQIAQFGRLVSFPVSYSGKSVTLDVSADEHSGGLREGRVSTKGVLAR